VIAAVPEIEWLRRAVHRQAPDGGDVSLPDAEAAVLTALARQRREIVEALRERAAELRLSALAQVGANDAADFIESRFGGEEAPHDPA